MPTLITALRLPLRGQRGRSMADGLLGVVFCAAMLFLGSSARAGILTTWYRNEACIVGLRAADGLAEPSQRFHAQPGWFYEIVETKDTEYILRFARLSDAGECSASGCDGSPSVIAKHYYRLEKSALADSRLKRLFVQGIEPGVLIAPFKYRQDAPTAPSQLTGEASLGAAIGLRFATDLLTSTVEPLLSIGITQVGLQTDAGQAAKNVQALTLATGLQLEIMDRLSLGLLIGWDQIPGDEGATWAYQGRPWWALSLSKAIFDRNPKSAATPPVEAQITPAAKAK